MLPEISRTFNLQNKHITNAITNGMLLHMMFWLFLFCSEPKFAGYLNMSKLCVSFILTSPSALVQRSTWLSASLSGPISGFYVLQNIILSRDTTLPLPSCSLETGKRVKESRHSELSCAGCLNRPTSTELDVASRRKHGGEFRVQFEHKVFEISGGLSPKYIQHLSVHQTKPRRAEKTIINWL